ncbi:MAG TPA: DUF1801 domain-containing protein [Rhodoglobus sp.]|nr:DUF1801 domain-containing protein [Rhodoglobus sp.]HQI66203.1 DUF1801 domain-containing protein [Rhodoglobus sp.]
MSPTESFSAEERAAMKERAKELKAQAKAQDLLKDLLAKIAEMPEHDRVIAETIHRIVTTTAPELTPKTWYGQPAYAKGDQIVCFFQSAAKFGVRYATLGFNEAATLDDGSMWPVAFAIKDLTPADETLIAQLVTKAVG